MFALVHPLHLAITLSLLSVIVKQSMMLLINSTNSFGAAKLKSSCMSYAFNAEGN